MTAQRPILFLSDGRTADLTPREVELIVGQFMKSDFYETIDSTPWTFSFCDNRADNAVLGSLIKKGVMRSQKSDGDMFAYFTDEAKKAVIEVLGEFGEKFAKGEGTSATDAEHNVGTQPETPAETGDNDMNKAMVGQSVTLQGYGKAAKKNEAVQVVSGDNTHVTLRFTNPKDEKDTSDVKFKLADGKAVGAAPESGFVIPADVLKTLKGTPVAAIGTKKPAVAAAAASAGKNGGTPSANKAKETEEVEEKAGGSRTKRESRTGISEMPKVSKTGVVIRMADKGFFGLQAELEALAKTDANAKAVLEGSWNKAADIKTWLHLPFEKAQAEAFNTVAPVLESRVPKYRKSLGQAVESVRAHFKLKAPKVAA
jgi:hypothetical protein